MSPDQAYALALLWFGAGLVGIVCAPLLWAGASVLARVAHENADAPAPPGRTPEAHAALRDRLLRAHLVLDRGIRATGVVLLAVGLWLLVTGAAAVFAPP